MISYLAQFRSPAVQRYVHELTTEIGDRIDNITGALSMFIEIGECGGVMGKQCTDMLHRCPNNQVPSATCCIEFIEFNYCSDILLCGPRIYVTVFIRFHRQFVVGFRECFLVFIAGVQHCGCSEQSLGINLEAGHLVCSSMAFRAPSFLTSLSRSPGHRVPWWVLIWIKRSPLVFLVMSVACFSAGLVLFTYASGQVRRPAPLSSYIRS